MFPRKELLLEMKPGSTATNSKPRKWARNGAIALHQNKTKNSTHNHQQKKACWFKRMWVHFGILFTQMWAVTNTINAVYFLVEVFCCNNNAHLHTTHARYEEDFWVSLPSTVFARPHAQWFSQLWTIHRGSGQQVFHVSYRAEADSVWVAMLKVKRLLLGIYKGLEHLNCKS